MTTKLGIPITSLPNFPSTAGAQLAQLWITTAEELASAAGQTNGQASLATFLGLTTAEVDTLVAAARAALPEGVAYTEENIELALGALPIDNVAAPKDEPKAYAELPPQIDLRDRMPIVRDQGRRGTCVAFAAAAIREFLTGSTDVDLSEQFLYFVCKQRDGDSTEEGTYIKIAMGVLKDLGVCPELAWPYNPEKLDNNEGQGPAPVDAVAKAPPFKVTAVRELHATWIDADLKKVLASGAPIAFSIAVFESLQRPHTYRVGDIRLPLPDEKGIGNHAMCMAGYVDDEEVPGGGYFLVRNSWGESFGYYGEVAPGYCRLPYEYVRQHAQEAFTTFVD